MKVILSMKANHFGDGVSLYRQHEPTPRSFPHKKRCREDGVYVDNVQAQAGEACRLKHPTTTTSPSRCACYIPKPKVQTGTRRRSFCG